MELTQYDKFSLCKGFYDLLSSGKTLKEKESTYANKINASVIISFYNKIEYLKLALAGFEIQSMKDFEIIIADDGSSKDVAEAVDKLADDFPLPVKHIWQEDNGFRKNRILNKAIIEAASDYLIFIDGDCVPHSRFVEEHLRHKENRAALTGRRVNLSHRITAELSEEKVKNRFLEMKFGKIIIDGIFGDSYDVEKGFYVKSEFLRNKLNKKKRGLLGCNMSMNKADLLAVNGFDERYKAPSIGEDSDLQYRLELNGVEIKSLNNIAVQYHLHHKLLPRKEENLILFEKVKASAKARTDFGIEKTER